MYLFVGRGIACRQQIILLTPFYPFPLFSWINRYTPSPQLQLSGPADFGVTVADGKVLAQQVFVINEGSLTGEFKIRYNGNQPITIMPSGGIVKPGAKQPVKVRCATFEWEVIFECPGLRILLLHHHMAPLCNTTEKGLVRLMPASLGKSSIHHAHILFNFHWAFKSIFSKFFNKIKYN